PANSLAVSRPMPEAAPVMKIDLRPFALAMAALLSPNRRCSHARPAGKPSRGGKVYGRPRRRDGERREPPTSAAAREVGGSDAEVLFETVGGGALLRLNPPQTLT